MYWQCLRCETSNSDALIECEACDTPIYSSLGELKKVEAKIKADAREAKRKARETIAKINADFKEWLIDTDEFYIEEADFYIETLSTNPYETLSINPYAKIKKLLNIKPPNLKALYIARHFCKESEKLKYSLRLLKVANSEKTLDLDAIWKIYQTTEKTLKPQVFNLLCDELGMILKFPQYEKLVYDEAKELFENLQIDKQTVELLGARVIANNLKNTSLSSHIAKIKNYTTGFIND